MAACLRRPSPACPIHVVVLASAPRSAALAVARRRRHLAGHATYCGVLQCVFAVPSDAATGAERAGRTRHQLQEQQHRALVLPYNLAAFLAQFDPGDRMQLAATTQRARLLFAGPRGAWVGACPRAPVAERARAPGSAVERRGTQVRVAGACGRCVRQVCVAGVCAAC
eukprot:gene3342-42738_t